jgi:hypothetical protein
MFSRVGLFALFAVYLSSPLLAQETGRTVMGIVVDSDNQPLSDVLVFLDDGAGSVDDGPGSVTTGAVGAFRLEGVTAAPHLLKFRRAGFAPRTYELVFAATEDPRDVGVIVLEEGPDPTATFQGRVTDGVGGGPLGNAVVKLNGDVVALTDRDGAFLLSDVPIAWGSNEFEVGRFSFLPLTTDFWIGNPDEMLDFSAVLDPAPIAVGGVVASVEARPRVATRLLPFYERMEKSVGSFITREFIDSRSDRLLTDLVRTVPGVRTRAGPYGREITFRRQNALFSFDDTPIGDPRADAACLSPLIFLDGQFIGGGNRYYPFDQLANSEDVEGIEVYAGIAATPIEFTRPGSECGVISVWTR